MRIFLTSVTCLLALNAAAQSTTPAPEATVDAGVPAAVAATPAAPPKEAPPLVRVYGLIKPTVIVSTNALESYSQPNETAVTAAANPTQATRPGLGRWSFQAGQSRLGVHVGEGTPYHAQIETDFLDFTKPTPTVQAVPRIRIAKLDWKPTDAMTITAGQDWDLVQPVNPHGINLVGALFEAGNSAYMRQQVKFLYNFGLVEVGAAVGFQSNNATAGNAKDGFLELGETPTFAIRAQLNLGKTGKVGLSGIATSLQLRDANSLAGSIPRTFAGLGGLYADLTLGGVNLRAEGYAAQNGANLYLLTLGTGRIGAVNATTKVVDSVVDLQEMGGFVSFRAPIDIVAIYGMFGGASVLNGDSVAPAAGLSIKWNMMARLGLDVKIWRSLSFMFEGFYTRTQFALAPADLWRGSTPSALGIETGFLMNF